MGDARDIFRFDQNSTAIADQYRSEGAVAVIARTICHHQSIAQITVIGFYHGLLLASRFEIVLIAGDISMPLKLTRAPL
jgi:hypothetical protein